MNYYCDIIVAVIMKFLGRVWSLLSGNQGGVASELVLQGTAVIFQRKVRYTCEGSE